MGYVQEARENHVKKKVEEALRSKMKQKALKECDQLTAKYAECASGRTFSVVWKCRKQAKELNGCLHQYTNDSVLEEMKKEYVLKQGIVIPSFGITNYVSAGWLLLLWELVAARKLKDHNLRKKLETR